MKNYLFLAWLLFISCIVASCDSMIQTIDVEVKDEGRKLVVNGVINPDSNVTVNVSRSLIIDAKGDVVFVSDATLKLYENDVVLQTLGVGTNGKYVFNHKPTAGKTYKIEAEYSDLKPISGATTLPNEIKILSIDTATVTRDPYGYGYFESFLECKLTFADPAGEKNLYMLQVWSPDMGYYYDTLQPKVPMPGYLYFNTKEPYIDAWVSNFDGRVALNSNTELDREQSGENAMFSDKLFNGKQNRFTMEIPYMQLPSDTMDVYFKLNAISRDYYMYLMSIGLYNQTDGNLFAEPVLVHSNFENGFGILGGYTSYSYHVKIITSGRGGPKPWEK